MPVHRVTRDDLDGRLTELERSTSEAVIQINCDGDDFVIITRAVDGAEVTR